MRKNVKDGDVHSLSGYLVALEGSKTDEEKFKHLQSGLAKLEPVFKNFGSQFHLDVTRPIRQLLGTVQQVSQRSQQKATHVSPKFTKRFNNLFKDAPDGLETAFLEWWQQYQKVSGFTKRWIQTHEQQVRLLAQRVFKDKYNPHDDVLTVNEALLNSKKFELLEKAAGDASVHSMAQLHLRKPGAQAVADVLDNASGAAPENPAAVPQADVDQHMLALGTAENMVPPLEDVSSEARPLNSGHMQVLGVPENAPAPVNAPWTFKDFLKHDRLDVTLDQTNAVLSDLMEADYKKWQKSPLQDADYNRAFHTAEYILGIAGRISANQKIQGPLHVGRTKTLPPKRQKQNRHSYPYFADETHEVQSLLHSAARAYGIPIFDGARDQAYKDNTGAMKFKHISTRSPEDQRKLFNILEQKKLIRAMPDTWKRAHNQAPRLRLSDYWKSMFKTRDGNDQPLSYIEFMQRHAADIMRRDFEVRSLMRPEPPKLPEQKKLTEAFANQGHLRGDDEHAHVHRTRKLFNLLPSIMEIAKQHAVRHSFRANPDALKPMGPVNVGPRAPPQRSPQRPRRPAVTTDEDTDEDTDDEKEEPAAPARVPAVVVPAVPAPAPRRAPPLAQQPDARRRILGRTHLHVRPTANVWQSVSYRHSLGGDLMPPENGRVHLVRPGDFADPMEHFMRKLEPTADSNMGRRKDPFKKIKGPSLVMAKSRYTSVRKRHNALEITLRRGASIQEVQRLMGKLTQHRLATHSTHVFLVVNSRHLKMGKLVDIDMSKLQQRLLVLLSKYRQVGIHLVDENEMGPMHRHSAHSYKNVKIAEQL